MNREQFNHMTTVSIFNAIWYAKYQGIDPETVKVWVRDAVKNLKPQ